MASSADSLITWPRETLAKAPSPQPLFTLPCVVLRPARGGKPTSSHWLVGPNTDFDLQPRADTSCSSPKAFPGTPRNRANRSCRSSPGTRKVRGSLGSLAKPLPNSGEEMRFDQSSNQLLRIENQTLGQVALATAQPQSLRTSRHQNRQAWRRVVQRGEAH